MFFVHIDPECSQMFSSDIVIRFLRGNMYGLADLTKMEAWLKVQTLLTTVENQGKGNGWGMRALHASFEGDEPEPAVEAADCVRGEVDERLAVPDERR